MTNEVIFHYDLLANRNDDPVHDPEPLRNYMDRWDGQVFIEKMKLDSTKSVLEVGVGTGRLAVRTAPLCGKFTGVDISPKTIKLAEKNLSQYENVNLICGDFMTLRLSETFDVVYSSLTFMHLKDKHGAVDKVKSLLKKYGLFVLSIDKNQDAFIDYGENRIEIYPDTPEEIESCIKNAQMTVLEKYETEFAHIFISAKREM